MRFRSMVFPAVFLTLSPAVLPAKSIESKAVVRYGIDNLSERGFDILRGRQIGLITNHTGVDQRGVNTADLLKKTPDIKLVALFSPEHGIRGRVEHGQTVGDMIDARTGLPVYSLYGAVRKPNAEMLNAVDVLVFDIQDVGARFYTYIATMAMAMEAAAERGIGFVVLDRPNPLGGAVMEGPMLDPSIRHFTAYVGVPVRHGMTVGELARWYAASARLKLNVEVIPMTGWRRDMLWEQTGLAFIPPSPNVRTPLAALLYAGVGMFEATNLSVGRGTEEPFERLGAPWLNGAELAQRLNNLNLPGLRFYQTLFVPASDRYTGQLCTGVRLVVRDPAVVRPVALFVQLACILRELYPRDFELRWEEIARVTGSEEFERLYKTGRSAEDILKYFDASAEAFREQRKPFLLY